MPIIRIFMSLQIGLLAWIYIPFFLLLMQIKKGTSKGDRPIITDKMNVRFRWKAVVQAQSNLMSAFSIKRTFSNVSTHWQTRGGGGSQIS